MSTLSDQITEDLKTAMKEKNQVALNVLRALKTALKYAAIQKGGADTELDEAAAIAVIRNQIKQRRDSLHAYQEAGRSGLAETEAAEIALLEDFLPAQLSKAEIATLVDECLAATGATTKKEMGAVMKLLQEKAAGRADGRALSEEVGKRLS